MKSKIVPTSLSQKQLFALCQSSASGCVAYNESIALRLTGVFDRKAFRQAVETTIARRESLRTTMDVSGEMQIVSSEIALNATYTRLSDDAEQEDAITRWVHREKSYAFDLINGPLHRIRLTRCRGPLIKSKA